MKPEHLARVIELRDTAEKIIRDIIIDGINSGVFVEIDVKIASIMITSMFLRARVWYSPKGRLTPDEIADFIADFSLHGLIGEKVSKKIHQ